MDFNSVKERAMEKWQNLINGTVVYVGTASCGKAAGADDVFSSLKKWDLKIVEVGCIGLCYLEPIIYIQKKGLPPICYGKVNSELANEILEDYLLKDNPRKDIAIGTLGDGNIEGIPKLFDHPMLKPQKRLVLRNCGIISPLDIDHYIARGGYEGIKKALEMTPQEVIEEVKKSGLRGRGGAGFPTGIKWALCSKATADTKYFICNADEGDPGAFMNRSLLEGDPHAVLEGMLIGGYAIGAQKGFIYIRAEYPLAVERLEIAISQMRKYNLLGKVLNTNFSFDITIRKGAGAFVCGEETALIASIEGKRGMPRPRPPYPAISGLWERPTIINNVETLGTLPIIMSYGSEWYTQCGKSKGTKTFSLVGKAKRSGLIEVPLGTTLKDIIFDIGGGIQNDKRFKAVQTGGPSGGCIPASLLNLEVDYESLEEAGSIMGSGGLVVMDEDTCMVDIANYFLSFTKEESCGKCTPCRIGVKKMLDILQKIRLGEGKEEDIERLEELAHVIKKTSLCGLGQTCPNPVLTTLRYFREEYEEHIKKRCPAKVCKALFRYTITKECVGCQVCKKNCPAKAIKGDAKEMHAIEVDKCMRCGLCLSSCPVGAIEKV